MSKKPVIPDPEPWDFFKIDEAVLALLFLNSSTEQIGPFSVIRAWKSLNRGSLDRLHEAGLIDDPLSNAKSVRLTEDGAKRAEETCLRLFLRDSRRDQIEKTIAASSAENRKALGDIA